MRRCLPSVAFGLWCASLSPTPAASRPNILLAISDDQSWVHASAYGCSAVKTPAFDRVARDGVLFNNAFGASPGCSPCRAALLTGRHTWMIEEAGTHASAFPAKYVTYPDLLEKDGYFIGYTGKGWGPGDWKVSGRSRNPAGPEFVGRKSRPPHKGISQNDYAGNFADFLASRPPDKPFCFWYGATEPHRGYDAGSGLRSGKSPADVVVPPFLPNAAEIRSDILDYLVEVEWFDAHLGRMLDALDKSGELQNTLVIVTSDNGMPFPRAKANCYEYGIHMPLAVCWGARVPGGRVVDDLVGFVDLTATILEAAGVAHPSREFPPAGRSILELLVSAKQDTVAPEQDAVFASRERHSSSRYNNWTYPQRAIRTPQFLYIRNFRPERWPAGDPIVLSEGGGRDSSGAPHSGYKDIDGSPSMDFLVAGADDPRVRSFLDLAVAKRPSEELFDVRIDPGCLKNLSGDPEFSATRAELAKRLEDKLRTTGDPRILDGGDVWETYPRYSPIRSFPAPKAGP